MKRASARRPARKFNIGGCGERCGRLQRLVFDDDRPRSWKHGPIDARTTTHVCAVSPTQSPLRHGIINPPPNIDAQLKAGIHMNVLKSRWCIHYRLPNKLQHKGFCSDPGLHISRSRRPCSRILRFFLSRQITCREWAFSPQLLLIPISKLGPGVRD